MDVGVMIAREDLEAVLEERPYQLAELVTLFERPATDVLGAMSDAGIPKCEKCGAAFLAKPNTAGRFCSHHCANATTGIAHRKIEAAAVLAQLQDGPSGRTAIARLLHVGIRAVQNRLEELAATGQIVSVGTRTGLRWVRPGWTPPAPLPKVRQAPVPIRAPRERKTLYPLRPMATKEQRDAEIQKRIAAFWEPSEPVPVQELRPLPAVVSVIDEGIEFEAVSIGSSPVTRDWQGGSSLTGGIFEVKR